MLSLDNPSKPRTTPFIPLKCNLVGNRKQSVVTYDTLTPFSVLYIQG
jgi:hypothetical protein